MRSFAPRLWLLQEMLLSEEGTVLISWGQSPVPDQTNFSLSEEGTVPCPSCSLGNAQRTHSRLRAFPPSSQAHPISSTAPVKCSYRQFTTHSQLLAAAEVLQGETLTAMEITRHYLGN